MDTQQYVGMAFAIIGWGFMGVGHNVKNRGFFMIGALVCFVYSIVLNLS